MCSTGSGTPPCEPTRKSVTVVRGIVQWYSGVLRPEGWYIGDTALDEILKAHEERAVQLTVVETEEV